MRNGSMAIALLLMGAVAAPVAAESGHDLFHSFYEAWQRPDGKGSCCNNFDCRPVSFRDGANGIEIQIEELGGSWHQAPMQSASLLEAEDRSAHACAVVVVAAEHR